MVTAPKKQLSPVEKMLWKYANDILGEDRVRTLTDEKYRPYWKHGGIAFLAIYLVFGHLGQLISNLVGFLYPAYCSIKALETGEKVDDTRWLTYWVVFSTFSLVDTFSGCLLAWIPFYWLAKVVFLVWCFSANEFNGSTVIYKQVIRPFFMKHEKKINKAMHKVDKIMSEVTSETTKITEEIRTNL